MKFCAHCENMLYMSVIKPENSLEQKLVYYCKNCDNQEIQNRGKLDASILVIDDNKLDDVTRYSHYLNKNLKYDPTLPRVNNILCANLECKKDPSEANEVIYMKYDHTNMQYLYYCCHCDHFWKRKK